MTNIAMIIQTNRLLIRPVELSDANDIFEYRSDAITNKYQGWVPNSINEVHTFIEKNAKAFNLDNSWFQLVLLNKENNQLIGDVGIHFLEPQSNQVELGCTIDKSHHGNGFAKESLKNIISILFKDYDKRRIIGSVDPNNIASIKLLESLNFTKEAHFRKSLFFKGEWVDDVVYAILSDEWVD